MLVRPLAAQHVAPLSSEKDAPPTVNFSRPAFAQLANASVLLQIQSRRIRAQKVKPAPGGIALKGECSDKEGLVVFYVL